MALNGNIMSIFQLAIPSFIGEIFEFQNIKMRTLFKTQDLWDLVQKGYPKSVEDARLKKI